MTKLYSSLLLASLMACAHAPPPATASQSSNDGTPPAAPDVYVPPIDPATPTSLDYFVGAWQCNTWVFPDDDTRNGIRIDVARLPTPKQAYAIEYTWSLSTAAGPYCKMAWSATGETTQFPSGQACRFGYRGDGGTWNGNELSLAIFEDPPQPQIPEQPRYHPGDGLASGVSDMPRVRITRSGDASFELHVGSPPVSCRRI